MRLHLVRHGESEGNVAATLQGCRLDFPLSELGRRQAAAVALRLAKVKVDAVIASPLVRARDTAGFVAGPHELFVQLDADLVELDWGSWTGLPLDEAMEREVDAIRERWRSGDDAQAPPEGESASRARERAARALARVVAAGPSAPVIVAHGRFNRILMTVLLGRPLARMDEIRQRNGSLSIFEGDGSGPFEPIVLDDVSHLHGLESRAGGSDSLK